MTGCDSCRKTAQKSLDHIDSKCDDGQCMKGYYQDSNDKSCKGQYRVYYRFKQQLIDAVVVNCNVCFDLVSTLHCCGD